LETDGVVNKTGGEGKWHEIRRGGKSQIDLLVPPAQEVQKKTKQRRRQTTPQSVPSCVWIERLRETKGGRRGEAPIPGPVSLGKIMKGGHQYRDTGRGREGGPAGGGRYGRQVRAVELHILQQIRSAENVKGKRLDKVGDSRIWSRALISERRLGPPSLHASWGDERTIFPSTEIRKSKGGCWERTRGPASVKAKLTINT